MDDAETPETESTGTRSAGTESPGTGLTGTDMRYVPDDQDIKAAIPVATSRREAFWTLVVGAPAALSVLRLWVESGGELQITLLLVSNVSPLNLVAALFATITELLTVVLIALFTAGGVLAAAVAAAPPASRLRQFPPLVAQLAAATPRWFVLAIFVLALLTWKLCYLPLLLPAAVATAQRPPWRLHDRWQVALGGSLVGLVGYGWLVGPAVREAWNGDELLVAALLVLPPLLAFGIAGPLPTWFARWLAVVAQLAIVALTGLVLQSAIDTPVLPLVVSEIHSGETIEFLRGHVISVDDVHVVILRERGGVSYVPTGNLKSRVLCGTPEEVPIFDTRIRDYHVEDSLLTAMGRHVRPRVRADPRCRIATGESAVRDANGTR